MNKPSINRAKKQHYYVKPAPVRRVGNSQLLNIKPYLSESNSQKNRIAGSLISLFPEVENCLPKFNNEIENLDTRIIYKTNKLIKTLRLIAQKNKFWWYEPLGNISIDKEIVLEWWNQKKKLSIYVCSNSIDFIKVWGADMDNEMEDGAIYLDNNLLKSLWEWIAN